MPRTTSPMTSIERRAVAGLAGIFALRLLGLFLILPVFALYAETLAGHTPFLVGMALGVYGLTQACLQIAFGMASDRFGRKPVIVAGLVIFAIGSATAALADTIHGVIFGRALQGAGAISAAIVALIADLTREEQRTKAMAIVGMTVGASFVVSLLLGPVLSAFIGVPGIFWLTALLAAAGIVVLMRSVPTPIRTSLHRDAEAVPRQFARVLRDTRLLRLDFGIFILHCALTSLFVVVPVALKQYAGMPSERHWEVYLPVMLLSVLPLFPAIFLAERRRLVRPVFAGAVLVLGLSQAALYTRHMSLAAVGLGLLLFFSAFNVLEATLPSLISRTAPADAKGTAIGVYSTFEFLGAFVGGATGGWLTGHYGMASVYAFNGVLLALWFVLTLSMPPMRYLTTRLVRVGPRGSLEARELARRLAAVRGVAEATVIAEEGVAYLKVDDRSLDLATLSKYAVSD